MNLSALLNARYISFPDISTVWTAAKYAVYDEDGSIYQSWAWADSIHVVTPGDSFKAWFPGFESSTQRRPREPLTQRSCMTLRRVFRSAHYKKPQKKKYTVFLCRMPFHFQT